VSFVISWLSIGKMIGLLLSAQSFQFLSVSVGSKTLIYVMGEISDIPTVGLNSQHILYYLSLNNTPRAIKKLATLFWTSVFLGECLHL